MGNTLSNGPQQRKSSSTKLFAIAVAAFVFLALAGTGFWYVTRHGLPFSRRASGPAPKAAAQDASPAAVFQLQTFIVNLADPDHSAFLRIGIALGLDKPLSASSDSEKNSPYTPQVRDAVLSVLSSWKSEDLLAPDGRKKLKDQLLQCLRQRIPELGVVDIYFTDFLIQQ